jgi:hypothetical protein
MTDCIGLKSDNLTNHLVIFKIQLRLFILIFEPSKDYFYQFLEILTTPHTVSDHFGLFSLKIDNKFPLRSIETAYNNYKTVRKNPHKMIKIVFLCVKNSLESRYLPFKSFVMAQIKSEIDWRGKKMSKILWI